jgi:ankyrin repeat protein
MHCAARYGTPATIAAIHEIDPTLIEAINVYDNEGEFDFEVEKTAMHFAVESAKVENVQQVYDLAPHLISKQASFGSTPMHLAVSNEYVEIIKRLNSMNSTLALSQNMLGDTPMHLAAENGKIEAIEALYRINSGLLKIKNSHLETPYDLAEEDTQIFIDALRHRKRKSESNLSHYYKLRKTTDFSNPNPKII